MGNAFLINLWILKKRSPVLESTTQDQKRIVLTTKNQEISGLFKADAIERH